MSAAAIFRMFVENFVENVWKPLDRSCTFWYSVFSDCVADTCEACDPRGDPAGPPFFISFRG